MLGVILAVLLLRAGDGHVLGVAYAQEQETPKQGPDGPWEPLNGVEESSPSTSLERAAPGTSSVASRVISRAVIVYMALAAFLLMLFLGWKEKRSLNPRLLFLGVALTLGAFLLRWMWPEHTVFHENHHGYDYLRSIESGLGQTYGFASSYIILMHEWTQGFVPIDDGVFGINALFSALQCPLLALLIARLSKSNLAGVIAGIMWALTPHAIRLAPTETYFNFVTCLFLAASLSLLTAMKRVEERAESTVQWAWILLALFLIILESRSRVLTLTHPLAVLLVAIGGGAGKTNREKNIFLWGGIAIAAALTPQFMDVLSVAKHSPQGQSLVSISHTIEYGGDFVFFDEKVVSPTLLPLAFFGILALIRGKMGHSRLRNLSTLLGFGFIVLVAGSVHGTFPSRVRFELPVNACLTGLAGIGIARLMELAKNVPQTLRYGGAGILTLSVLWSAGFASLPMHEEVEYSFLRNEILPELQAQNPTSLLVLDAPAPTGGIPESWWKNHLPNTHIVRNGKNGEAPYAYVGLECFWMAPGWNDGYPYNKAYPQALALREGVFEIHPACADHLGPGSWEPVALVSVGRAIPNPCVDLKPTVASVKFGLFKRANSPR